MAYTVDSKQVITDDRKVKLDTVKARGSYVEIKKTTPAVIGTNNAFLSGYSPISPYNVIQKFPYAIPISPNSIIGSLSSVRQDGASHTEGTAGFVSGGGPNSPPITYSTQIDKYPFAITNGSSIDVGDLASPVMGASGFSSETDGYTSGTITSPPYAIEKFPFAITSGTATTHTNNPTITHYSGSHSDTENGYISGGGYGSIPAPFDVYTTIKKFPFAAGASVTSIGNLSEKKETHSHHNSETHAYAAGGNGPGPTAPLTFSIDKFPFAITSGTASSVGTLTPPSASRNRASNSSTTNGFISGQGTPPAGGGGLNTVHSFPFAITSGDASTTSVSLIRLAAGGHGADD